MSSSVSFSLPSSPPSNPEASAGRSPSPVTRPAKAAKPKEGAKPKAAAKPKAPAAPKPPRRFRSAPSAPLAQVRSQLGAAIPLRGQAEPQQNAVASTSRVPMEPPSLPLPAPFPAARPALAALVLPARESSVWKDLLVSAGPMALSPSSAALESLSETQAGDGWAQVEVSTLLAVGDAWLGEDGHVTERVAFQWREAWGRPTAEKVRAVGELNAELRRPSTLQRAGLNRLHVALLADSPVHRRVAVQEAMQCHAATGATLAQLMDELSRVPQAAGDATRVHQFFAPWLSDWRWAGQQMVAHLRGGDGAKAAGYAEQLATAHPAMFAAHLAKFVATVAAAPPRSEALFWARGLLASVQGFSVADHVCGQGALELDDYRWLWTTFLLRYYALAPQDFEVTDATPAATGAAAAAAPTLGLAGLPWEDLVALPFARPWRDQVEVSAASRSTSA